MHDIQLPAIGRFSYFFVIVVYFASVYLTAELCPGPIRNEFYSQYYRMNELNELFCMKLAFFCTV